MLECTECTLYRIVSQKYVCQSAILMNQNRTQFNPYKSVSFMKHLWINRIGRTPHLSLLISSKLFPLIFTNRFMLINSNEFLQRV